MWLERDQREVDWILWIPLMSHRRWSSLNSARDDFSLIIWLADDVELKPELIILNFFSSHASEPIKRGIFHNKKYNIFFHFCSWEEGGNLHEKIYFPWNLHFVSILKDFFFEFSVRKRGGRIFHNFHSTLLPRFRRQRAQKKEKKSKMHKKLWLLKHVKSE